MSPHKIGHEFSKDLCIIYKCVMTYSPFLSTPMCINPVMSPAELWHKPFLNPQHVFINAQCNAYGCVMKPIYRYPSQTYLNIFHTHMYTSVTGLMLVWVCLSIFLNSWIILGSCLLQSSLSITSDHLKQTPWQLSCSLYRFLFCSTDKHLYTHAPF